MDTYPRTHSLLRISPTSLAGRTALVTGAGRGIGRAIAVRLAASGVAVAVVAGTEDELAQTVFDVASIAGRATALVRDLTDFSHAQTLVSDAEQQLGPIDILINNVGVVAPLGAATPLRSADIDRAMRLNFVAPVILSGRALARMRPRGWGRIVNVSSGAVTNPRQMVGGGIYAAIKAALQAHALNLAAELEGTGVTVNIYRPGRVGDEMAEWICRRDPARLDSELGPRLLPGGASPQLITPEASAAALVGRLGTDATGLMWDFADDQPHSGPLTGPTPWPPVRGDARASSLRHDTVPEQRLRSHDRQVELRPGAARANVAGSDRSRASG
jgi:NAD(P)-dependent dehydrogenase (short-subunit alcohol dehydrogenase family)